MVRLDRETISGSKQVIGSDQLVNLVFIPPGLLVGTWRVTALPEKLYLHLLIHSVIILINRESHLNLSCLSVQGNSNIAFVIANFHFHRLVERSLLSSPFWYT